MPAPTENCDWFVIERADAARVFDDPQELRFLRPFFDRENTVAEAARELGVKPLTMFRHVKRLEALGLVRVARLVPRDGRPIKRYRSVASRFFAPFCARLAEDYERVLLEQDDFWRPMFVRGLASAQRHAMRDEGLRIFRDHRGIRQVQASNPLEDPPRPSSDRSPTWSDWSAVKLEAEDALNLQREMRALFEHYTRKNSARGRFYLMRTALAPLNEDDLPLVPR